MPKFLYVFGYESPDLAAANKRMGSDFEDSEAFWIDAPTREEALSWGDHLADAYMQILHHNSHVTLAILGYGGEIEDEGIERWWTPKMIKDYPKEYDAVKQSVITVRAGERPDLEAIILKRYGTWDPQTQSFVKK